MVDVTPPLRSEPPFDEFGNFTIRYAEYFERAAESTTTNEDNIDLLLENLKGLNNGILPDRVMPEMKLCR